MAQWKVNFDDLDLGERIGKGNFGEVYKGTYLGTDVAIKKLFFVDDDFMQKGLSHPNIVQLMGLCIETDDMYIITEFITGGDLRSKLKDKSVEMDWKLRVEVLRDIALAMNYLHSKSIMHRDLKSHNLLVGENWKVKVCDFGLARSAPTEGEEANHLMTIVGTNEWMAPEVAMGESYDKSADVFSFGMVIYELITRDKPPMRKLKDCYAFNGDDHAGNIPSDTPPALWDLLLLCAARDPQDRPDFKKVVDSLKTILENLPAKAVKKSTDSGKKKSTKKAATADKEEDGEKKKKKKKKTTAESAEKEEDGEKKKKKKKKTTTEGAEKKEEDGEKKKKKKKKTTTEGADGEKKKKKSTKKDDENGEKKKKKSTKKAE